MAKKSKPKPKPKAKPRPAPRQAPAPQTVSLVLRDPHQILPAETVNLPVPRSVNDDTQMVYGIGVDLIEFTPDEERVLDEALDERLIRWKPQKKGPPIPFISWTGYTKWLNRAFGRKGWRMVPAGKPIKGPGNSVLQPHILYIKGKPHSTAWGEQDYFENNAQQSYGDAVESTRASALRRCMKQLGVGIELWDKDYVDGLRRKYNKTRGGDDGDGGGAGKQDQPRPPAQARTGDENRHISQPQRIRLFTIGKNAGRQKTEITEWLKTYYGIPSSAQLKIKDYDAAVAFVEAREPLPTKGPKPEVLDEDINWELGRER